MSVAGVDVHRRVPYEESRSFGEGGAYERLEGVVRFAVDPDATESDGITDMRLAPRDAGGMVRFEADFCVLRPAEPARASGRLPTLRRLDLGERAAEGIARFPAVAGEALPCFVSAVDDDGNEVAGIRLPDLTVPLASHTGWNPRRPESGAEGELIDMLGSSFPLPRTREERGRTGDPRRSIAERYTDRDHYCRLVREAAGRLVSERHLLAEDVEPVVARAAIAYDLFTDPDPPTPR